MESPEMDWFLINAKALEAELEWLRTVVGFRVGQYFGLSPEEEGLENYPAPVWGEEMFPYKQFVMAMDLEPQERLVLILALAPHLRPSALDLLMGSQPDKLEYGDFGGVRGQSFRGMIPTVETALFLLSGKDIGERIAFKGMFHQRNPLLAQNFLRLEHQHSYEPANTALLLATNELLSFVTTGHMGDPEFGPSFPAQKIDTQRDWSELVLPADTLSEIQDILNWITLEERVMREWRLAEKVAPGFRALFYGPPGTGKTFTASLLGKATGRDVYRIDLSMVVSKYIGETEKNLKVVFDKAQTRGWILFFDEADALFGKRTDVSDSKDRYANQEVSYLLQRVESFDGIVILATNNRDNMDKAFTRRFQSVINFPIPNASDRLRLWERSIPESYALGATANLLAIADRYEISGGSIMNVVRHSALRAAVRGAPVIEEADLLDGIRREYKKAGRVMG